MLPRPALRPGRHGSWLNEEQSLPPGAPRVRPPCPEHRIAGANPQPRGRAAGQRQLVPTCAHFKLEYESLLNETDHEIEQGMHDGHHAIGAFGPTRDDSRQAASCRLGESSIEKPITGIRERQAN